MGPLMTMYGQGLRNENAYQGWYGPLAKMLGLDPNPDAPEHHYDHRAFFQAMKEGRAVSPDRPGGHFPSEFKTDGHPRTYLTDPTGRVFDTRTARYMDGRPVPRRMLRESESSPDMPFYGPEER